MIASNSVEDKFKPKQERSRKMKKRLVVLGLSVLLLLSLMACAAASASTDLMKGIRANEVAADVDLSGNGAVAVTDFGVRIFQKSMRSDENTLISPVSVLYALAMTANGATGGARAEMEEVLGMPVEELNTWLHIYLANLPEAEQYKMRIANSVWFTDEQSFTVNEDFLQTNADYYSAGIYKAPFDASTRDAINDWVEDNRRDD